WDVLSWGGETQALIYHPGLRKVIAINALGVAPAGATPEYFAGKKMAYPPDFGPDAMVTPGTPGGLMVMLAEYGTLSLKDVLAPAIAMADGYPIEAQTANSIENNKKRLKEWPYAKAVMLPHLGQDREAPEAGEIFRQADLAVTLRKLVETEQQALRQGKSRKAAIMAAYDRFYKGDIAEEYVRGAREQGSTVTMGDLANWQVRIEEPVSTTYKGIEVYKLNVWTQGPALLQALNILENADLKSMGYNSTRYVHALYQAMNLAFADRDFYYGDIYFPPEEPVKGLLSKEYGKQRYGQINWAKNDATAKPGDPYPFQGGQNPYTDLLAKWSTTGPFKAATDGAGQASDDEAFMEAFYAGTTSIQAADSAGWVVSVTQRGGARQASAGDADALAGAQGRGPVPVVRGAGRRFPGPEPAPVLPEHGGVGDDAAAGGGGAEHQQLPDAGLVRRARVAPGPDAAGGEHARLGPIGPPEDGLHARVRGADLGPDQRHLVRPEARQLLGRLEQPRRGLRHCVVVQRPD
ncbi:MAG: Gamma-glutamyltranspeptidase, partial [Gemmatimonadetes bacterium]|nr:Gamma-glutamyltranspeptidase [Gemmatimonadota bacterium]